MAMNHILFQNSDDTINKIYFAKLVALEILGDRLQGLTQGVFNSKRIYHKVCKGLTKCWNSEIHLVVSSEFWKSVVSFEPLSIQTWVMVIECYKEEDIRVYNIGV